MAITNHERIGKCLEQLTTGLKPFVEREEDVKCHASRIPRHGEQAPMGHRQSVGDTLESVERCVPQGAGTSRAQSGERATRCAQ